MDSKTEVVAFVVLLTKDGVVYLKRNDNDDIEPGKWCLPSGHVEKWETCEKAAIRELNEETGIKAEPNELEYLGTFNYLLNGKNFNVWLYFVEKAELTLSDISIFAGEHSGKKCIKIDTLAKINNLRIDTEEKFTGIDMHIIANYIPDIAARINRSEATPIMHNISKMR